ncbi:metallophosphoesterase [Burkholderia gladioli]|uniref:P-loop NTPase n=1 Tax=Burkholderia gladioli TaxID=28095 RepID=UPI00163F9F25|nr:metallophosphoesterase [Burkholderia gladioli]
MSNLVRWLHLSDFHFGLHPYEQKFSAKKLIEHLQEANGKGESPDFIFITGDVANSGKLDEYELFVEEILSPIIGIFGNEFLDKIFIVPGNHDLDRNINDGFSKEKFGKTDSPYFYPTSESAKRRNMLVERFSAFCENSLCASSNGFSSVNGAFSEERQVNTTKVGIVGLNTAWLCDGERDKESLTPGIPITREALDRVADAQIKFVLGHHPFDWVHPAHKQPLQAIFAAHQAIYLHGHMHTELFSSSLNGAGEFLTIQAGAAWQAPEGGKWKNGFMWGVADLDAGLVKLKPFHWSFENQCWTLDGSRFHDNYRNSDWWEIEAPRARTKPDHTSKKKTQPLVGWEIRDLNSLEHCTKELEASESVGYFDGAIPTWSIALSDSIPRREIVGKLSKNFRPESPSPYVCVLLGAGCEGKTTALLQSCLEVLRGNKSKKILYRTNHTRPFVSSELQETLRSHDNWLVVIDEADQVAKDILRFIDAGFDGYAGRVDFLLASRDSDWHSSGAKDFPWTFRAKFKEEILKDLSLKDAELIVGAWSQFGREGLGEELALLPQDERAAKLRYYAKKESKGGGDAFFGALLMSRHGNDLLQHAESMLQRLATVELPCGKSLKDVLGFIAAMHAEGFEKLNFSALASLLEMSIPKVQSVVLRQLGKEAAATSTSTSIFTRHKYIAAALIDVLETKFNEDISHYYIDLAISEVRRSSVEHVIDLAFWRYDLADKLFSTGKTRLAIDIARNIYDVEPSNFYLVAKLASLYRKQGNAAEAISLFRNFELQPRHRGFYFEWGVCEGIQRNRLENALLATFALSDESEVASLTVENAKVYLNGLSKCCDQLHIAYADRIFSDTEAACNSILSILGKGGKQSNPEHGDMLEKFLNDVAKKRKKLFDRVEAIKLIKEMSLHLSQYGPAPEVIRAIDAQHMMFTSLDRIVRNVEAL